MSYRDEEHGEKVDHCLHVEAPFGSNTGRGQEHQAADCWEQHLGDEGAHGEDEDDVGQGPREVPLSLKMMNSDAAASHVIQESSRDSMSEMMRGPAHADGKHTQLSSLAI